MTLGGSARPIDASAARTRSRLSATALSGKADDGELRQARRELDLHLDGAGFEAEISDGGDGRGHQAPPPERATLVRIPPSSAERALDRQWPFPASGLRERAAHDQMPRP